MGLYGIVLGSYGIAWGCMGLFGVSGYQDCMALHGIVWDCIMVRHRIAWNRMQLY